MVPRPRAPKGLDRPTVVRDRGMRPAVPAPTMETVSSLPDGTSGLPDGVSVLPTPAVLVPAVRTPAGNSVPSARRPEERAPVALTRTPHGWAVVAPCGSSEPAGDLVEGLTLADLVVEELGLVPEPDRTARRSARGSSPAGAADSEADPRDVRIAALERTVAQLEHALAARVATERAIGVLSERHGVSPREAFDALRQEARAQSRPVQDLAREVLDGRSDPGGRLQAGGVDARVADGRS